MNKTYQLAFGKTVRKLREQKGWTQEQLAEKADLHPTYVSDVERGKRNLSLENIVEISRVLGLKTYELFRLTSL